MDPVGLGGVAPTPTDARDTPDDAHPQSQAAVASLPSSQASTNSAASRLSIVSATDTEPDTDTSIATADPAAMLRDSTTSEHQQDASHSQPQPPHPHAHHAAALPRHDPDSQDSTMTSSSSDVFTPTASEASNGGAPLSAKDDQLHQLSALAAAQRRMVTDGPLGGAQKRTADGLLKSRLGSTSPVKTHSRTKSAVSVASTTGSNIGELSAELKTRLSYAMVKVTNGWQSHSLEEVESLASRAASPSSTTPTIHRRSGSSASPVLPQGAPSNHLNNARPRPQSTSPPNRLAAKPTLAPPAPIQPSTSMGAPRVNARRNSNPRYTPTLLSHSHSASASPHTPVQPHHINTYQSRSQPVDPVLFSPQKDEREQDAIETLLFMSTPGNSTNLKHAFSPNGSPGSSQASVSVQAAARHALPSGPRKALPSQRQPPQKKMSIDRSPGVTIIPGSPMDVDSPQQAYLSPHRAIQRRRTVGATSHLRGALSLPSGLALGNGTTRKALRDEDIERMLDRAGAEEDSSDDEEIQLPRRRAGAMASLEA